MPVRRSFVYELDVIAYTGDECITAVRLELRVSSGTYIRAIAQALGGHCTSLRRLTVGPFSVEEAADVESVELLPPSAALDRLSDDHLARVPATVRAGVLAFEQPTGGGAA
jgi:tRNA U55 pseudouridine synthase TruB